MNKNIKFNKLNNQIKMLQELCIYLDSFGTKYNFFTDGKPRFYTILGGALTIISYIFSLLVFMYLSIDDFRRVIPNTVESSVLPENHRKIKFNEEKIWIPWRVVDYYNNFVNHTGLIYPIIYYYEGERKSIDEAFIFKSKKINYRLCNETSMVNKSDIHYIDVPLDKLYCIDMDNLEIGGSWITLFINYIKIDFYLCENGIDYNETNYICTNYSKIYEKLGKNNSVEIEFYYPDLQFQPTNKNNPFYILYRQYYYHLSKYTNKIVRLFLQKCNFLDDNGWFSKNINNYSYWGTNYFSGDTYSTPNQRDLINEGSSSRVYSLNIYLEPSVKQYKRTYKKIIFIFTQSLPIVYIVLKLFRKIAKIFKSAEQKRKLIELLFENLKKKKRRSNHILNQKKKQFLTIRDYKNKNSINSNNYSKNKIMHDNFINKFFTTYNNKNLYGNIENDELPEIEPSPIFLNNKSMSRSEALLNINKENNTNVQQLNQSRLKRTKTLGNKRLETNGNDFNNQSQIIRERKKEITEEKFKKMENMVNEYYYVKGKLFPYKFYFFSVFIKNIDIRKNNLCFSKKYIKAYSFINQMMDISTYLLLIKEFQLVKNIYLKSGYDNLIEHNKKINVNSRFFRINMKECIDNKKFSIFAKNT